MLQNEPLVAKIGVDPAQNGSRKGLKKGTVLKVPDGHKRRVFVSLEGPVPTINDIPTDKMNRSPAQKKSSMPT